MRSSYSIFSIFIVSTLLLLQVEAALKKYEFNIQMKDVSRLCYTKSIVTVNGMYPGPTIYAKEGDNVLVNVTKHSPYNISIHWHGLKQYRNGWADGAAYITQCPIRSGRSYTYAFDVRGQRGTLWWHAHISWLRATVYGAMVIKPKHRTSFPFPKPHSELNLLLGEWWNSDVEAVLKEGNAKGLAPNSSDAYTINGKSGPLMASYPCSRKQRNTYVAEVKRGKTYLLRIINTAMNDELFFSIANHTMTVVEVDAVYVKPFSADSILISPGQTTNVLVQANQHPSRYFMALRHFMDSPGVPVDNNTCTAVFQYKGIPNNDTIVPTLPQLPLHNDTSFALHYYNKQRSLNNAQFPAIVPLKVDRKLFMVSSFGANPCPTCFYKMRFAASLNNITFVMPHTALLQAHYYNITGVFQTDFPDKPHTRFNYTSAPLNASRATNEQGITRVSKIKFNSTVELVLQGTNLITASSHPFHLHGYHFFVVGTGIGNFDPSKDPAKFNLVDPPERNTANVPTAGWTAIRFRADNPGVWLFHCHMELHTGWGLKTAFVVEDGPRPDYSVLPPPKDLPRC